MYLNKDYGAFDCGHLLNEIKYKKVGIQSKKVLKFDLNPKLRNIQGVSK